LKLRTVDGGYPAKFPPAHGLRWRIAQYKPRSVGNPARAGQNAGNKTKCAGRHDEQRRTYLLVPPSRRYRSGADPTHVISRQTRQKARRSDQLGWADFPTRARER
jgi:hypothetical protein